jgi:molybdate transport system substrate-binding protein
MRIPHAPGALLLALLAACGARDAEPGFGDEPGERPLVVLAASDLQFALPEIAAGLQARTGIRVELVLGSTGNLATQIENGAPGDVFLAANEAFVDRLQRGGWILDESRRVYAVGRLALTWLPGAPEPAGPAALAGEAYRTIAIANPEHAPYGLAARQVLQSVGAWEGVQGRLVLGENVAQTMQFVRTGNVDAAIVALGVVIGQREIPFRVVDDALHEPLRQAGAVLRESHRPAAAAEFLAELTGPGGQEILRRYGFESPDAP